MGPLILTLGVIGMQPWQVSLGLSVAIVIPAGFMVLFDVGYLDGYWGLIWDAYAFHIVMVPLAWLVCVVFGTYQVSRLLFLGDVGSRVRILDRSLRAGRGGEPELVAALAREESQDYES